MFPLAIQIIDALLTLISRSGTFRRWLARTVTPVDNPLLIAGEVDNDI